MPKPQNNCGADQTRAAYTFIREAVPVPETIDEAARTFEVVWSKAGSKVRRFDWWRDVPYDEELSLDPAHVRMQRMEAGIAPLLDSHRSYGGVGSVLGVIDRAWLDGDVGRAVVRLSSVGSVDEIWTKIKERILRSISVGYSVYRLQRTEAEPGGVEQRLAIDWEPLEISLVPVPADPDAVVRDNSASFAAPEIVGESGDDTRNNRPHQERTMPTPAPGVVPTPTDDILLRNAPAAVPPVAAATPNADEIIRAANERSAAIFDLGQRAGMAAADIQAAIESNTTIDVFRSSALDAMIARQAKISNVQVTVDEGDTFRANVENALTHRLDASVKLEDGARQYRGKRLLELGREFMSAAHGVRASTGDTRRDASIILGLGDGTVRSANSTSDFPLILANIANRTLRASYELARGPWRKIASGTELSDYKPVTRLALSEAIMLLPVAEGGEYQRSTLEETGESYQLGKFGRIIGLTREALINDDLGAFGRLSRIAGRGAASLEESVALAALLGDSKMSDGKPLFHDAHYNLGAASAIDEAGLDEARQAIRAQTGLGETGEPLNLEPRFLIVGPKQETAARKQLSGVVASTTGDVNIFANSLELLVFSRITGPDWYLSVDPAGFDTIEYAYLSGEQGLYTEERVGFDVDGLEIKVRLDFAAKAIDHRGFYKNPGE